MKYYWCLFCICGLMLCGCNNDEEYSSVESHFGIDGTVTDENGAQLEAIELILLHDNVPLDTTYTASDGSYWFGGDAQGMSIFWILAQDTDTIAPLYASDSVRVVLDYRGGNGRANLGNGTATCDIVLSTAE